MMDLIIGAGISGISYANFTKNDFLLIEKEMSRIVPYISIPFNRTAISSRFVFFHFQHPDIDT